MVPIEPKLEELVLGEILGLRLVVQQLLGRIALSTKDPQAFIEAVRQGAIEGIVKSNVEATGLRGEEIKGRAEFSVNDLCDRLRVSKS